jgi:formiminoglutamase
MQDLYDFFDPIYLSEINEDEGYIDGQLGKHVTTTTDENFDWQSANILLVGVTETRGNGNNIKTNNAANLIRQQLYKLHYWHTDIALADFGNIKTGATLKDSYAAIKTVLEELYATGKTVIIIGGSHDITLAQYQAYQKTNKKVEATCIDAKINLSGESAPIADNFLMHLFTGEPFILSHYNHVAFQSYYAHPRMLQTIDKLLFDCYRLGKVTEHLADIEPIFRNSHMVSFDISALKNSDAPASIDSPNGLTGVEACTLTQFAGMSNLLNSFGMYGYNPEHDVNNLTAKQIAQMLWYFIDGVYKKQLEAPITELEHYNEYHVIFGEVETSFLQNKRTGRWWMKMPTENYIACSHKDYITASRNDYPEIWLRVQERN